MNSVAKNKPGGVFAVVLAAGSSRRMGAENKLLVDIDGMAMVRRVVTAALASEARAVIVVTGFEGERIVDALSGLDVRFVDNPDFADGLSTSLKVGINAVSQDNDCTGAVILLADMPRLSSTAIDRILERFRAGGGESICVPVYDGRRGNPVLWPRRFFPDLGAVTGDKGGRDLLQRLSNHVIAVEVDSPEIFFDVDTPDDLART
jgi:molybdenum cofactor cytidylyltransferase